MFEKIKINSVTPLVASLMIAPAGNTYANHADLSDVAFLEPISVIATKGERPILETPSSVSVINYEEIKRKNSKDIKELFDEELDIEVRAQSSRFGIATGTGRSGQESINIRGLEGNQILMMIDGIPIAQGFNYGAVSTGRGDYVDMEGVSLVEVLRGPTATQYGSDGLAGAVNFQTLSVDDLLKFDSKNTGYIKGVHRTINQSNMGSIAFAHRNKDWSALMLSANTYGAEEKNQGKVHSVDEFRTSPNPEKNQQNYLLGKFKKDLSSTQSILLTIEDLTKKRDTDLYSGRTSQVYDLDAIDSINRQRFSIDLHSLIPMIGFEDEMSLKLWTQKSNVHQLTMEDRLIDRQRNNETEDNSTGLKLQFVKYTEGQESKKWTYGLDLQRSQIKQSVQRTGDYNDQLKYHPDTLKNILGMFTQLELDSASYSWIPAIRFDKYSFKSDQQGYSLPTVNLSDSAWSPSLAGIWKYRPSLHPYINLAKGFKAPTQDQINNGFSNLRHGYTSKGNPDLKSETSDGLELGLKGKSHSWRYTIAAYRNKYKDFIEQQVVGGTGRPGNPLIYQYVNHSQAQIQGLDIRVDTSINPNWRVTTGWVTSKGYKQSTSGVKSELDTIQPMRAALGLMYKTSQWQVSTNWTHIWAKKPSDVNTVTDVKTRRQVPQYVAPAYSVVNLHTQWKPTRQFTLFATISNLLDKKYWRWSDVRGLEASSPVIDAYTASGRSFSLGTRYDF